MPLLDKLKEVEHLIGNTPLVKLEHEIVDLYTKLEYHNLANSVKARTAYYILKSAIERGEIREGTTVIESSSGNFAIALATLCKYIGIKFIAVIDPNINALYESLLRVISYNTVKVTIPDNTGGFLLSRLEKVQGLLKSVPHAYWPNQYKNKDNFSAHYCGLGSELVQHFDQLDYAFISVSTGGTISGVSVRLKEKFTNIKIIAVDSEGSIIFGGPPRKRHIPGMGASIVPEQINRALIDDVMIIPELKTVQGCHELFEKHAILAGGSSGALYYAVHQYFQHKQQEKKPTVAFLCPDSGAAYINTIYNPEWVSQLHDEKGMIPV